MRAAATAGSAPEFSRERLQRLLWQHVGLERDATGLAEARAVLAAWAATSPPPGEPADITAHEDAGMLVVAQAMTDAALARRHSLGAHHRRDDTSASGTLVSVPTPKVA